jgi:hypothetical protein
VRPAPALAAAAVLAAVASAAVVGSGGSAEATAAPWTYAQSMSQRRSYLAAAELGGKLFAAGGMVGETGRRLSVFQRFDPVANAWTTLPRLPEAVRAAAGAALDGEVYVVGGDDEDGDGTDVFAFGARRGWEERAPLPAPRFNHAAVALDGKLYVLGGYDRGEEKRDVFVYDPNVDSWSRGVPLPRPNHAFGAVVFRGEIWVIGGRRGDRLLREIWIYDPGVGRWRAGPPLPKPMELLGAAVAGERIHAIWESTYQIYDAATGRWSDGPRSLTTRHGLKAFYVDGDLYTIGGCTTDLHDSQVVERRAVAGS